MPSDAEELRVLGIEPAHCRIIVVKAAIAWRAAYGDLAAKVIEVDTPGACAPTLASLDYRCVRRLAEPLDCGVRW